jgi:hypothetical protein
MMAIYSARILLVKILSCYFGLKEDAQLLAIAKRDKSY